MVAETTATMTDTMPVPASSPRVQHGLLRVLSNDQINRIEASANEERKQQSAPVLQTLASYIEQCWSDNLAYKTECNIDQDMIDNLRQREGKYSAAKQAAILAQGGSDIFMGLTAVKCRAAESWISDVFMSNVEKPWSLEPTPIPDLPPMAIQAITQRAMQEWMTRAQNSQQGMTPDQVYEYASKLRAEVETAVMDEATLRVGRMEKKIEDQFEEGGLEDSFDDFITDMVTLKAGILKGPVVRKKRGLKYSQGPDGRMVATVEESIQMVYSRVSPFDLFPSRGAGSVNEGELCERQKFTRRSLLDVRDLPGYRAEAINLVLSEYAAGGLKKWTQIDQERAELEKKGDKLLETKNLIEGIEFWGSVQGKLLIDHGMFEDLNGGMLDPMEEYEINAIKIGNYVVYARINPDPLFRRPYCKTGYAKVPGSFWYKSVCDLMADLQQVCNAAIRALVNNMGIASGPQVVIEDINRIPAGENITQLYAWKIWQLVNKSNSTLPGINFHDVQSNAPELMAVYEKFAQLADDYTGIPAYAYGNDRVAGAGRTSSGLAMLMNSATRGIKKVIYRIDKEVMKPLLQRQYDWNMLYDPDESIKGDVNIKAIGALGIIVKEQMAARRMEYLQATNNPTDLSIIGPEKRANVLRAAASVTGMPSDEAVPSKEEMKRKILAMAEMAKAQAQGQGAPGQMPAGVGGKQ